MSFADSLASQSIATSGNVSIAGINASVQSAAQQESVKRAALTADMWTTGVTTAAQVSASKSSAMLNAFMSFLGMAENNTASDNAAMQTNYSALLGSQTSTAALNDQLAVVHANDATALQAMQNQYALGQQSDADNFTLASKSDSDWFAHLKGILASNLSIANINSGNVEASNNGDFSQLLGATTLGASTDGGFSNYDNNMHGGTKADTTTVHVQATLQNVMQSLGVALSLFTGGLGSAVFSVGRIVNQGGLGQPTAGPDSSGYTSPTNSEF